MKAVANQLYPPEPPLSFPPARQVMAEQLYPPEPPLFFPPAQNALADQLYPPEPPLSFPPAQQVMADQLYPPEPPLSFPPAQQVMADQLYPPEPPLSFPPAQQVMADQLYPPEPPLSFPPLGDSGAMDLSVDAARTSERIEAQPLDARAGVINMLGASRTAFGMEPQKAMDLSHLYIAGALLMVVVVALTVTFGRRKENVKKTSEHTVDFADSYEPFLG